MNTAVALKVLIVLTNHSELGGTGGKTGWYLPEVAHPYFVFRESGVEVDFVSPKGGYAPMDEKSKDLSDPENAKFFHDNDLMERTQRTLRPDQVNPKDYQTILFAGGHGTMWDFPGNVKLAKLASNMYEKGGIVAAVCHGPAGLINLKLSNGEYLVSGKSIATFTDAEEREAGLLETMPFLLETRLRARGAKVQAVENWKENVVVDGRLITGQNPASAKKLAKEVVRALRTL